MHNGTHENFARERKRLIRDKYNGDAHVDLMKLEKDLERLASGEPLAYVVGWVPFLSLHLALDSHPLIPRPETEAWTEQLIGHLHYRFAGENPASENSGKPFRVLDLCSGSGAIGLAILWSLPNAHVSFGEIDRAHIEQIKRNIEINELDASRADVRESDLFQAFGNECFDIIVANPPYIPDGRALAADVINHEPHLALFGGADGADLIRKIIKEAPAHLLPDGELWMECDSTNVAEAERLARDISGARETTIHQDIYGRPRLLVAHFS